MPNSTSLRAWYQFSIRLIALTVLGVSGCGDNPKETPTDRASFGPRCKAISDEYCPRLEYCKGLKGVTYTSATCKADMLRASACNEDVASAAQYNLCLDSIKASTCDNLYRSDGYGAYTPIPAQCPVILYLSALGVAVAP